MMKEWFKDQRIFLGLEGFLWGEGLGWKYQAWEDFGGRKQRWYLPWEFLVLKWWRDSKMDKFILVIFLLETTCSCKSILHHSTTLEKISLFPKLLNACLVYLLLACTFLRNKYFGFLVSLCFMLLSLASLLQRFTTMQSFFHVYFHIFLQIYSHDRGSSLLV